MAGFTNKIKNLFGFDNDSGSVEFLAKHMTPESLASFANKYNLRVQRDDRGSFVSLSRNQSVSDFMSFYENWCNTYTSTGNYSENRMTTLGLYDIMDENMTEASQTLDAYSEEAISYGVINDSVQITCSNDEALQVLMETLERNKIFRREKADIRTMCKYGDAAYTLSYPQSVYDKWNSLPEEERKGRDPLEFFNVKDLIITPVNPKNFSIEQDENGEPIYYKTTPNSMASNNTNAASSVSVMTKTWQPWQFARFTLTDDITHPYGKSILYGMRTLFDQLSTLEALLAMSRASKVSRLVIRVPVPGDNAVEAFSHLSQAKAMFKSQIFSDAAGTKTGRKVAGLTETFFMPSNEGYEIDTLKNDIDISSTEDVDHFTEKALRATRLPKGFFAGEEHSDTGAALAERDQKFAKALLSVQDAYVSGLTDLCACILTQAGYDVNEVEVEVSIERPTKLSKDTIDQYKNAIEMASAIRDAVQSPMADKTGYGQETNFAQLLIIMGIPVDFIRLCLARNPINVIDNTELTELFKDLEVKVYNKNRSDKYQKHDEEDLMSKIKDEEDSENEDNKSEESKPREDTTSDNIPINVAYNSYTGGNDPEERDDWSVTSSKKLHICESGGIRKVVSKCTTKKNLSGNRRLKQQLQEVYNDLSGKNRLNG